MGHLLVRCRNGVSEGFECLTETTAETHQLMQKCMELDAGCDIGTSYCKRTVAALCADSSNGSSGSTPDEPTFVLPKLDDDLPSGGTSALSRCCFDWESAMSSVRVWRSLLRPLLCRVSAEEVGCRLDDQSECSSNTCIPWHNTRTITKKNTDFCRMPHIVVPACALAFGRDAAERTDALCELLFIYFVHCCCAKSTATRRNGNGYVWIYFL